MKKAFFTVLITLALWLGSGGCVVMPARYVTDKDGKTVMVEPERLVPAPIVINAYPSSYPASVVYESPVVYESYPVVYNRPYYSYRVYYDHYPRRVHTIHIGGRSHNHHHRHWQ